METQDSYYPLPGNGGLDALHYRLRVGWDPHARILSGTEHLDFKGLGDGARLDLSKFLKVTELVLDGRTTSYTHDTDGRRLRREPHPGDGL